MLDRQSLGPSSGEHFHDASLAPYARGRTRAASLVAYRPRFLEGDYRLRTAFAARIRLLALLKRFFGNYRFNSITRRIIVLNFVGVAILVGGILCLNQYRVKFTETRVQAVTTEAEIIAGAIAQTSTNQPGFGDRPASATEEYKVAMPPALANQELMFRINPELVAPILRDLIGPTKTRARIFDTEGNLLLDSQQLYTRGQIGRLGLTAPDTNSGLLNKLWIPIKKALWTQDLPVYTDKGPDGKAYEEVRIALAGTTSPLIRVTEDGETVISVAVPIRRHKSVLGALMLTSQDSETDAVIASERWQIIGMAALAIAVTAILSWLLAGTIAGPMRRLALAAERVRKNIKNREQIPDFSHRSDEIGYLSRAFRDMTNALYLRLDAIESFAADVSHELKNPLTSLRNAAGMLSFVKKEEDRQKLIDIIQHDVRRLDRLITDISDASRLDAELARETAKPVNIASLLGTLCEITKESRRGSSFNIILRIEGRTTKDLAKAKEYMVNGHDSRLSQVITNLLENAISFSPAGGAIYVSARKIKKENEIEIAVEDEGPGISPENLEKIFHRFYTDRPESFGQNSGLGLNISQQIVKAHNGRIWAENRLIPDPVAIKGAIVGRKPGLNEKTRKKACKIGQEEAFACGVTSRRSYGARFIIRLPAANVQASRARDLK